MIWNVKKKDLYFSRKIQQENKAVNKIKSNNSYFFKYANRFKSSVSSPIILTDKENNAITSPKHIANMLQDQFKGVFSTPFPNSYLSNYNYSTMSCNFPLLPMQITENDIITAINEIKSDSKCARSDVPAKVLKECKLSLCKPLKLFWEKSFNLGEIPDDYKRQNITPIYKKGNRTKPENFRPIVVTPHEIKIMERVIRKILTRNLENNNIINSNQRGFRKKT